MMRFALASDELDEARRIRRFVAERVQSGGRLADVAILYRTNSQSRALETELRQGLHRRTRSWAASRSSSAAR